MIPRSLEWIREALGDLWGPAFWVVLGCLICQMGLGFTYVSRPFAGDIIADLDLSRAQFSAANGPQLLLQALASPLVGFLTVRMGASRVLAISSMVFTGVFVFFARIETANGLYVAIALLGLAAAGMGDITVGHVVSQTVKRGRGLALGLAYTGSNLGGFVWVGLTAAVAEQATWREGILSLSLVSLLILLPTSLFLVRDPRVEHGKDDAPTTPLPDADEASMDLRAALRTRSFWILTFALFSFFFFLVGVLDHLVLFLVDSGMERGEATAYYRTAVGLGVVSKVGLGVLADRMPQRSAFLLDYGLVAASAVLLLFLPSPSLLWIFVVVYGFSTAARDVVYPLILGRCFGIRYMGEIYGAMMVTLLPGGALGPIFAAAVHDATGSYILAFSTFAGLTVVSFLGLLLIRDERPTASGAAITPSA